MEVFSFRAEKCFCFVKTWLFRCTFYHHSRLVGQRPFLPLECHEILDRQDGPESISSTLLFRNFCVLSLGLLGLDS